MTRSKKIAVNTIALYIRMILIMLVSLYTSRVVLNILGVEDYGIYNVVGGFASMLAFFTVSLSNATQRFLSTELGRDNIKEATNVFSQSLILYGIISLIFFVVAETLGLWFLNNKMTIPLNRIWAAHLVYQCSILSMILAIQQVVYVAVIISRERMTFYAYLGLLDVVLRLMMVFLLQLFDDVDHLILYAILMLCIQIFSNICYIVYCHKSFPECHILLSWNYSLACKLLSFIGYNFWGCLSWSFGIQGANIILNIFFGPVVNAARGVSVQVNSVFLRLSDGFMTAVKPQIIKSYAAGEREYVDKLLFVSSKYGVLLMLFIAIPILYNIDYLLKIWLINVPDYSNLFCTLMVVETIIGTLVTPLWMVANATGKIKRSQLYGRLFTLAIMPLSYLILRLGIVTTPVIVFVIIVLAQICYWLFLLFDVYFQIKFNLKDYFKKVIWPLLIVCVLTITTLYIFPLSYENEKQQFLFSSIMIAFELLILSMIFCVTKKEKGMILSYVKSIKQ